LELSLLLRQELLSLPFDDGLERAFVLQLVGDLLGLAELLLLHENAPNIPALVIGPVFEGHGVGEDPDQMGGGVPAHANHFGHSLKKDLFLFVYIVWSLANRVEILESQCPIQQRDGGQSICVEQQQMELGEANVQRIIQTTLGTSMAEVKT